MMPTVYRRALLFIVVAFVAGFALVLNFAPAAAFAFAMLPAASSILWAAGCAIRVELEIRGEVSRSRLNPCRVDASE